jgi:hypothetical protein
MRWPSSPNSNWAKSSAGNPGWKAITLKISPEGEARLRLAAAVSETRKNLGEIVDALLQEHLPPLPKPKGR